MCAQAGSSSGQSIEDVARKQNHYVSHLADVNKETDVVSTEDIYNSNGVLVVPKGVRINKSIANKVLRHKLENPLEEQVQLGNSIDRKTIQSDLKKLFASYSDLQQIHDNNNFEHLLSKIILGSRLHPILIQKLTILQKQLPQEYEKSLFCGWLAALLAHEMELDEEAVSAAFIAGLVHDVGLLNIAPETLNKQGGLTADEWRAIQSHVVICKLILVNIPKLDPRIAEAVQDHHERCDGSGYPARKMDKKVGVLANIIGMADSMQAIRIKQFEPVGRNLLDALPYLHMNSQTHSQEVYGAMCHILKKSRLTPSNVNPCKDYQKLVGHLLQRGLKLKKALKVIDHLAKMVDALKSKPSFCRLAKVALPVESMIRSSGILDNEMMQWLKKLKDGKQKGEIGELADIELMQNELYWQLKKLEKSMRSCLDSDRKMPDSHRTELESFATDMAKFLA
ncbi:MAG: HD domain-containing protein [Desulfobulbaceae bacterium]|nr:HD domain-containing protein [Desulfobulbaceae bacterium]